MVKKEYYVPPGSGYVQPDSIEYAISSLRKGKYEASGKIAAISVSSFYDKKRVKEYLKIVKNEFPTDHQTRTAFLETVVVQIELEQEMAKNKKQIIR